MINGKCMECSYKTVHAIPLMPEDLHLQIMKSKQVVLDGAR